MKLTFKGGKTNSCLSLDTDKKTYVKFNGMGSNSIALETQKALNDLELTLIKNGYVEEK